MVVLLVAVNHFVNKIFQGVSVVPRKVFGLIHISTVTGEVWPVVPKLTPVVFPKLNEEPNPGVILEPLLFRYTDFGTFGEVVVPVATCVPVDPVAFTVAPGVILVQIGVVVPAAAGSELDRVPSKFKSKSVEDIAE